MTEAEGQSDRIFGGKQCWDLLPDHGPAMQIVTGHHLGEPAVSIFVGDEMVVLRRDTTRSLCDLLDRLCRVEPDRG